MQIARRRTLWVLPIVGLVVAIAARQWYAPADLLATVTGGGWAVVAVAVALFYLVRPFVLWPLSVCSVFLGYLVGFPLAVPLVLAGTLVTCLPPYVLAERFRDANGYVSAVAESGTAFVDTTGELRSVIAARLSPAPADAVSIGAGLAGVSGGSFALGTVVGELPWAVFYVLVGRSIRTFSAGTLGTADAGFVLLVTVCGVVLLARPAYRYVSEHRQ